MSPKLVTSVCQAEAPWEGPGEGIDQESSEMHPGDPRGKADEGANHGKEAGEEDCPVAIPIKPAIDHIDVVVGDEDIPPIAIEEGPAPPHPHPIGDGGANGAPQGAVEPCQEGIARGEALLFYKHPATQGHDYLAWQRDTGALYSHKGDYPWPPQELVDIKDELEDLVFH